MTKINTQIWHHSWIFHQVGLERCYFIIILWVRFYCCIYFKVTNFVVCVCQFSFFYIFDYMTISYSHYFCFRLNQCFELIGWVNDSMNQSIVYFLNESIFLNDLKLNDSNDSLTFHFLNENVFSTRIGWMNDSVTVE